MYDEYWKTLIDIRYKREYLWHYQIRAQRICGAIDVFSVLTTLSGITSLILLNYPFLWSIVIAAAQALQICKPYMPYSKQAIAMKFFMPQLDTLLIEIEHKFNLIRLGKMTDEEIAELVQVFSQKYNELDMFFIHDTRFPIISKYEAKAEETTKSYLFVRYQIKEM